MHYSSAVRSGTLGWQWESKRDSLRPTDQKSPWFLWTYSSELCELVRPNRSRRVFANIAEWYPCLTARTGGHVSQGQLIDCCLYKFLQIAVLYILKVLHSRIIIRAATESSKVKILIYLERVLINGVNVVQHVATMLQGQNKTTGCRFRAPRH